MSSPIDHLSPTVPRPQSDQDYEIYPISLATESVNKALTNVSNLLEQKKLPVLQSGEITFKTTVTTGWSLGLSFFVLTFLFSRKHQQVTEVTIHYQKDEPKPVSAMTAAALAAHSSGQWIALEDELVKQIEEIAQATSSTQIGGLPLQQIVISVQFGIDWKVEGGVNTPTLVAVTADMSKEKDSAHSVKLTFQNPSGSV